MDEPTLYELMETIGAQAVKDHIQTRLGFYGDLREKNTEEGAQAEELFTYYSYMLDELENKPPLIVQNIDLDFLESLRLGAMQYLEKIRDTPDTLPEDSPSWYEAVSKVTSCEMFIRLIGPPVKDNKEINKEQAKERPELFKLISDNFKNIQAYHEKEAVFQLLYDNPTNKAVLNSYIELGSDMTNCIRAQDLIKILSKNAKKHSI